jgi:hypothetical protein
MPLRSTLMCLALMTPQSQNVVQGLQPERGEEGLGWEARKDELRGARKAQVEGERRGQYFWFCGQLRQPEGQPQSGTENASYLCTHPSSAEEHEEHQGES